MHLAVAALLLVASAMACAAPAPPADDPTPLTLDAFKAAATRVLDDTGVPGAGIALVRADGIEWAGGLGWADRDARVPVAADTLFRAGSISKTFVALALVQLYEDGRLDLDAPLSELVPGVAIDNPWASSEPVRLRHVLEHTAGFDDMHFNEMYVLDDAPDAPLETVLARNPASRRVRWRPGTRMAYSNPGYAVAGRVIEAVAERPFDEVIGEKIFTPLGMRSSTFSGAMDDPRLAQGYDGRTGPPVTRRRIHLRPAGALHTSARELGQFVEMLLLWGERGQGYVVDPEYLSNMEWPRTTAASSAGVRAGYGLGIFSTIDLPYPVLGHQGGIDGFLSVYGYSPSRDVGYVVLVNSTHAPEALRRLSSLALRYLKRDLEPPAKETIAVAPESLTRHEGYYHDAAPRNALLEVITFPLGGRTVRMRDGHLEMQPTLGPAVPLVPVNDGLFRRDDELTASLAFTDVEGRPVIAGATFYAERRPAWPMTLLRVGLAAALALVALGPIAALGHAVGSRRRGWTTAGGIGVAWTIAAVALAALFGIAAEVPVALLGVPSSGARAVFAASIVYPLVAALIVPLTVRTSRRGVGPAFATFAALVAAAHVSLASYLGYWGLLGFRSWTY